jgi:hypothetical protein
VRVARRPQLRRGVAAVQREQQCHAVDGGRQVAVPAVERLPGKLGVHVGVVAREREARDPGPPRGERRAQRVGQGALAGPVQAFDDYQAPHGGIMPGVGGPAAGNRHRERGITRAIST